jgi:hypothetical protein
MSILLKEDFILINTSAWDNFFKAKPVEEPKEPNTENSETVEQPKNQVTDETPKTEEKSEETKQESTNEDYPSAGQFVAWGEWLDKKLKENAQLSQEARQDEKEILNDFFKNFFETNWAGNIGQKLYTFERLRQYFIVKGKPALTNFNPENASFLKYLIQNAEKLSQANYAGLLVAYSKNYVARGEWTREAVADEYNLLHCPLLYKLPSDQILGYLALQANILSPNSTTYDPVVKDLNKKVFLKNSEISEVDPAVRAAKIKAGDVPEANRDMTKAVELNDIAEAKRIFGGKETQPSTLGDKDRNKILQSLGTDINSKYAALVLLSSQFEQNSTVANALANDAFKSVDKSAAGVKVLELINKKVIPVGVLDKATVDSLAKAIVDSLATK